MVLNCLRDLLKKPKQLQQPISVNLESEKNFLLTIRTCTMTLKETHTRKIDTEDDINSNKQRRASSPCSPCYIKGCHSHNGTKQLMKPILKRLPIAIMKKKEIQFIRDDADPSLQSFTTACVFFFFSPFWRGIDERDGLETLEMAFEIDKCSPKHARGEDLCFANSKP